MARLRRHPEPADPYEYALETLELAASARLRRDAATARLTGSASPRDLASAHSAWRAVARCAATFGQGVAGLVNALDPSVVALGGLAIPLHATAADEVMSAYLSGLMAFRRREPPALRPSVVGRDGPLVGAADIAWDLLLTESGLIEWDRLTRASS
jgi:predicted NBD/HSP70 family sugar kinase